MKFIKRCILVLCIAGCMYITAKWPEKVVSTAEAGYMAGKAMYTAATASIWSKEQ